MKIFHLLLTTHNFIEETQRTAQAQQQHYKILERHEQINQEIHKHNLRPLLAARKTRLIGTIKLTCSKSEADNFVLLKI